MSFISKKYSLSYIAFFSLVAATPGLAGELSVSTEVQTNIKTLSDTKSCPQCDLSGAILNRLDLSGANLEGADLSRAKMYLSNLSGANLRNANLKEAEFGGADLADADLTGADLTGASLIGAYLVGAKLDGEMVSTKPYVADDISEVEENVYVEDTVKPKSNPATDDITIGSRRDFEETPPAVIVEIQKPTVTQKEIEPVVVIEEKEIVTEKSESSVPEVSVAAPMAKSSPAMQSVLIQEPSPPAEIEIENTEPVVVLVPIVAKTVEVEVANEGVVQDEIVNNPALEEIPVEVEKEMAFVEPVTIEESVELEIVEEQTVEPQITGEVVEDATTSDESEVSKETVEQEIIEEEPVKAVASRVDSVQTAMVEAVTVTLPDNVLINIERLLDTRNCYGCDLSWANLSGINLDSADLEGANLLNASLVGADLEDANLKGANLTNADLSGADLSGADLYKADLSGANLSNAILEKALLDDANMNGVIGYQPNLLMMEQ